MYGNVIAYSALLHVVFRGEQPVERKASTVSRQHPEISPRLRRYLPALFTLVLFGLQGCAPPEPIHLGFVGGLSGRVADLGIDGRNGVMLAIELRNKAGGVKGRSVELLTEDDQQNADTARKAVAALINHKVEAIIGPMTSTMATVVVPLVNQAELVMVSPTVTTNELSGLDDYFFRVLSPTREFSRKSAEYHFQRMGMRRVAAIYDLRNKSYTESWLGDYRVAFVAAGGSLTDSVSFSSSDETHFGDLAGQLLGSKPDGILILANSVDAAMLCQQVRKLNPTIPIATSEWAGTERLIELGGRAVEGIVIGQFLDRQSKQPSYVAFHRNYVAHYGKEPGFAALTAYDAANVVMEGLEHRTSGQSLKQALLARKTFAGAQSPVVFDAFGDTSRESFMTTVRDASFVVLR